MQWNLLLLWSQLGAWKHWCTCEMFSYHKHISNWLDTKHRKRNPYCSCISLFSAFFVCWCKVRVLLAASLMSGLSVILSSCSSGCPQTKAIQHEEILHITVAEAKCCLPSTENTNKHYIFTFPFCCLIRERCPGDCSAVKQEKSQLLFFCFCSFVNTESPSLSLLL